MGFGLLWIGHPLPAALHVDLLHLILHPALYLLESGLDIREDKSLDLLQCSITMGRVRWAVSPLAMNSASRLMQLMHVDMC